MYSLGVKFVFLVLTSSFYLSNTSNTQNHTKHSSESNNKYSELKSFNENNSLYLKEAKRHLVFAASAYKTPEQIKQWDNINCYQNTKGINITVFLRNKVIDTFGFVGINKKLKEIIVSFRGTTSKRNWEYNLDTNLVDLNKKKNIKIHTGFKKMFDSLSNQLLTQINNLVKEYPQYKIVLTGHSLGGALASLAFYELGIKNILAWNSLNLYTYGQPRVGNKNFAKYINSKANNTVFRITNSGDNVPFVPSNKDGYYHFNREIHIKNINTTFCNDKIIDDLTCYDKYRFQKTKPYSNSTVVNKEHHIYWGFDIQKC